MCGETGALGTHLADSSNEVRVPQERRITPVRSHKWRVAARLDPQARGGATNFIQRAEETPAGAHRSSLREAMNFLHAPSQIGAPPAMNADASSGFSCMGCQSPHIALDIFDGEKNILLAWRVPLREAPRRREADRRSVEKSVFAFKERASRILPYWEKTIGSGAKARNNGDTWGRGHHAIRRPVVT